MVSCEDDRQGHVVDQENADYDLVDVLVHLILDQTANPHYYDSSVEVDHQVDWV